LFLRQIFTPINNAAADYVLAAAILVSGGEKSSVVGKGNVYKVISRYLDKYVIMQYNNTKVPSQIERRKIL
jgi:hypothetical protein